MSISEVSKLMSNGNSDSVFSDYYEKYLITKGEESKKNRGYSHFHPSAFGGCIRSLALQYYSELDDSFKPNTQISPNFVRICDAGHAFHHRMQHDMGANGILRGYWKCRSCGKVHGKEEEPDKSRPIGIFIPETCECLEGKENDKRRGIDLFEYEEIFLQSEPEYNFKGNTDGILEFERGNPDSRYVIDFKTINCDRFPFLKAPDNKYIVQIHIYMWLTGVHKAIIFYEEKNRHELKEFIIKYDEDLVENIKLTAKKLKKVLEMGKLPKRPTKYRKDSSPCKYCDFLSVCYRK
jgi:CRISPR/Cas system-associated exonuclease Cas4 (RecB family)